MANEVQQASQKTLTTGIINRVGEMEKEGLVIPSDYSPANALNIAYLQLEESGVLNKVTPQSVAKALLNMVIQGLSPAKTQVYFIPYGNTLQMQRSYFGTQTAIKRLDEVDDVWANVIYEDDEFEMTIDEKGVERFVKHKTNWQNRDGEIVGAYAIVDTRSRGRLLTVMTKKEIDASWSQGKTKNVQQKFPQEMAKRTVINRAAKNILNTSTDNDYLVNAINDTTENEYDQKKRRQDVTDSAPDREGDQLIEKLKEKKQAKTKESVEQPKNDVPDEVIEAEILEDSPDEPETPDQSESSGELTEDELAELKAQSEAFAKEQVEDAPEEKQVDLFGKNIGDFYE
ncbi:MAG: recombinase RecT [Aerococcus sanguinicola]|uniref:recombinase RecT n=1 Tax=Aerococcus sp. HMSC062A02 TaxID=1715105 RepID=UPI0008A4FB73|nr:recombinase RecT [Aerococcus sp. HMSC062A02]